MVERLTKYQHTKGGIAYVLVNNCEQDALQKLAAYEDTGLTPEELSLLSRMMHSGKLPPSKPAKIIVSVGKETTFTTPCSIGDTVWVLRRSIMINESAYAGCSYYISTEKVFDVKQRGFFIEPPEDMAVYDHDTFFSWDQNHVGISFNEFEANEILAKCNAK